MSAGARSRHDACSSADVGDVSSAGFSDTDARRLREYMLKGGFVWTDDQWGSEEWDVWTRELAKIFPPGEYPIEEITPADPIFRSQFVVTEMPQVANIGYWRRSGGDTSEQGADSAVPYFHAVRDHHGRIGFEGERSDRGRVIGHGFAAIGTGRQDALGAVPFRQHICKNCVVGTGGS